MAHHMARTHTDILTFIGYLLNFLGFVGASSLRCEPLVPLVGLAAVEFSVLNGLLAHRSTGFKTRCAPQKGLEAP